MYSLNKHIVQSDFWKEIKNNTGAKVIEVDGLICTLNKVPFLNSFLAYVPKISPNKIDFNKLKEVAQHENILAYRFDVPFIIKNNDSKFVEFNEFMKKHCKLSPTDIFTKYDILLDLTNTEENILANFKSKTRYNIGYAEKNNVEVLIANLDSDFDNFWDLLDSTAKRQHYFIRSKDFYYKAWKTFKDAGCGEILIAKYKGEVLGSWFLSFYKGVGNYMYGGSSTTHQNLQASSLLAYKSIKLAKERGATVFDFWGSDKDLSNSNSKFYGVTRFKLGFGGEIIEYMDSYDFVVNKSYYNMFLFGYKFYKALVELKR